MGFNSVFKGLKYVRHMLIVGCSALCMSCVLGTLNYHHNTKGEQNRIYKLAFDLFHAITLPDTYAYPPAYLPYLRIVNT